MDIRKHLKTLSLATIKDIVRRHDELHYINLGQNKDQLIEALSQQYESQTGTHLIPKPGRNLIIEKKKLEITKKKPKTQKEIDDEEIAAYKAKLAIRDAKRAAKQEAERPAKEAAKSARAQKQSMERLLEARETYRQLLTEAANFKHATPDMSYREYAEVSSNRQDLVKNIKNTQKYIHDLENFLDKPLTNFNHPHRHKIDEFRARMKKD